MADSGTLVLVSLAMVVCVRVFVLRCCGWLITLCLLSGRGLVMLSGVVRGLLVIVILSACLSGFRGGWRRLRFLAWVLVFT